MTEEPEKHEEGDGRTLSPSELVLNPILENSVQIWIARTTCCFAETSEEEWLALLSADEQQRCLRARVESVRQERILSRVLTRQGLSFYSNRPPHSWQFSENDHGRPLLVDAPGLSFNASHSRGLVVCAFAAGRELGVDTESYLRKVPANGDLGRFLAPSEHEVLGQASGADTPLTFFRFWTLKEAYAKARGVGLSIGFGEFSIELPGASGNPVPGTPDCETGDTGDTATTHYGHPHPQLVDDRTETKWILRELAVPPDHFIGLAVEQRGALPEGKEHSDCAGHRADDSLTLSIRAITQLGDLPHLPNGED